MKKATKTKKAAKVNGSKANGKLSQLDAAALVLKQAGEPLNTKALVERMTKRKLWVSPKGATPWATLHAAISKEIRLKGTESRFRKADRGLFALAV
jgi:hypothetical protein